MLNHLLEPISCPEQRLLSQCIHLPRSEHAHTCICDVFSFCEERYVNLLRPHTTLGYRVKRRTGEFDDEEEEKETKRQSGRIVVTPKNVDREEGRHDVTH